MNGRPGFMRLGQLEEERARLSVGYQITISLSADVSFGVLQRMPDGERCTIPCQDLAALLGDLTREPSQTTLHAWFERKWRARR